MKGLSLLSFDFIISMMKFQYFILLILTWAKFGVLTTWAHDFWRRIVRNWECARRISTKSIVDGAPHLTPRVFVVEILEVLLKKVARSSWLKIARSFTKSQGHQKRGVGVDKAPGTCHRQHRGPWVVFAGFNPTADKPWVEIAFFFIFHFISPMKFSWNFIDEISFFIYFHFSFHFFIYFHFSFHFIDEISWMKAMKAMKAISLLSFFIPLFHRPSQK